jgi:hypothetical protein
VKTILAKKSLTFRQQGTHRKVYHLDPGEKPPDQADEKIIGRIVLM